MSGLVLLVFVLAYVLFVLFPRHRAWVAVLGAGVLVLGGATSWHQALFEYINWNVIGLFFGTLVLAELFMQSRMPAVMAEALTRRTRTVWAAMMGLCLLASFLSLFLENVAVVLLVAPVAISLAERANAPLDRLLILIAISSNLQGTATLIGDPPSMILAGHLRMSFNDFFVYRGRPGIFFAVQAGAVASWLVAGWLLRRHQVPAPPAPVEKSRSLTPTYFLVAMVLGLSIASLFDPDFEWFAGVWTMTLAGAALVWQRVVPRWSRTRDLVRILDWDTTFFLMGVFVLVGALGDAGWLERLAHVLEPWAAHGRLPAFTLLTGLAVLVSGFVDNVPFLLTMIPVTVKLAARANAPVEFLLFGLVIGTCLGGNITPIGASANVVAVGLLRKQGKPIRFGPFLRVSVPFTIASMLAASAVLWIFWAR